MFRSHTKSGLISRGITLNRLIRMGKLIFINGDGPFDIRCAGMLAGGIHDLFPAQKESSIESSISKKTE